MGVKLVEIPKGSGKWYVRINFRKWRKTKLVGSEDAARETARYLSEAFRKFGLDAIELVEPTRPDKKRVPNFSNYCERFLQTAKAQHKKASTLAMYEWAITQHLKGSDLGEMYLDEIDYGALRDFMTGKAEATYRKGRSRAAPRYHYSKDSLRNMAMTLSAIMEEARKEGLIRSNPVEGLADFYRKRKKDRAVDKAGVFTLEEIHRIEDAFRKRYPELFEFVMSMSREGIRIGEAIALECDDVDFGRGTVTINKNVSTGTGQLEDSAKTEASDRVIEFSSEDFMGSLKTMLWRRGQEEFANNMPVTKVLFPWEGRTIGRIDYSNFLKRWNRVLRLAKVPKRPPHVLRHSWASHMLASGEDIAWVSRHLGHAHPGITLAIYAHFIPGKKRTRASVMDRSESIKRLEK